jgi:type IX secretion system PorP/SprF family membrane protein
MRKLFLFLLSFVATVSYAQHQTFYSQYIYSGLLINPAYAGSQEALNITAAYRNQWTGFSGAPKNFSFALHSPLRNKKVNLGLLLSNEKFGITTKTDVNVAFAYRVFFKESSLSFGLQAGYDLLKNDWSLIKTTDQNDPNFVAQNNNQSIPKFGAGVYYTAKKIYAGLSFPTLYRIDKSSVFSPYAMNLYSGVLLSINKDVVIKPSVLIKYLHNAPLQFDVTSTFYLNQILGFGFGYRSNDAVYAFVDLKISKQFNLGYGYDFTTSQLKNYSAGSHEIMLRYLFKYNVNSKSVRYF